MYHEPRHSTYTTLFGCTFMTLNMASENSCFDLTFQLRSTLGVANIEVWSAHLTVSRAVAESDYQV
eukprot:m.58958 g.58958  ORF g.58958 m.58958 type:complete len:66 (+) comp9437_c0_seq1:1701-1898(+)